MVGFQGFTQIQNARTWALAAFCGFAALFAARLHVSLLTTKRRELKNDSDRRKRPAPKDRGADNVGTSDDEEGVVDLEDLNMDDARPERLGIGEVSQHRVKKINGKGAEVDLATSAHLPGRQRVHVKTFGCPHNQSDGEYLMGQLQDYGYTLVDTIEDCDAVVVNSCTVKNPAEIRAINLVSKGQELGKRVVLAGCLASSDKKLVESMNDVSVLDVTQLDRIVEVVEETIKGHSMKLLEKRTDLPSLSLPKVRKDKLAEIITINAGCLGNCTYCKTKMARGKVVSYSVADIVARAVQAASEGVCQIELASEDMGAYGIDIGTNIVELLLAISDALPPGVMLRTGMTNPPFIMQHIDGIVEALRRPNVHAFMHIPVQSGSDAVLQSMRREYTCADFELLADKLKAEIPDIFLMTDIICGFPTESEENWQETMALCRKYKFHGIHVSQFYARPSTPAAKLKPLKSHIGKDRYRELTDFTWTYNRNEACTGQTERVWFTGSNDEHGQSVGRTKNFAKVVVPRNDELLGRSAMVKLGKATRLHVEGEVLGEVR